MDQRFPFWFSFCCCRTGHCPRAWREVAASSARFPDPYDLGFGTTASPVDAVVVCESRAISAPSQTHAHYLAHHRRELYDRPAFRHQVGRLISFPGSTCHSSLDTQIQLSWHGVDSREIRASTAIPCFGKSAGNFFRRVYPALDSPQERALATRRGRLEFRPGLCSCSTHTCGAQGDHLFSELTQRSASAGRQCRVNRA